MNCEISGNHCQTPVVTPQGHVFEKSLIEKVISSTGICPLTQQKLTNNDLIILKNNFKLPIAPALASVPALLVALQNEFDATIVSTFHF
jgi:pre-mRNA-processing factor 19